MARHANVRRNVPERASRRGGASVTEAEAAGATGWRGIAPLACQALVLAVVAVVDVVTVWSISHHGPDYAWDLRAVCEAGAALGRGADPYVVGNLGQSEVLSFPYLPMVAWAFRPVCAIAATGPNIVAYLMLLAIAACGYWVGAGLGLARRAALLFAAAAPAIFAAGFTLIVAGNPAILEMPLMVAAILAWHRGRDKTAGALIGAAASIKIIPLLWLAAFPLLLGRHGMRAAATGLASFAAILAANLLALGPFAASFLRQLVGGIPGQHSPFGEAGGGTANPDLPDLLLRVGKAAGVPNPAASMTVLALGFLVVGMRLAAIRAAGRVSGPRCSPQLLCLTLLIISATLFRLKPYGFVTFVPMALACCVGSGGAPRPGLLAGLVLGLPLAGLLAVLPGTGPVLASFYQLLALLFGIAALLLGVTPAQREPRAA